MTDDENETVAMAECGSCRTVIPLDSEECPECQTKFSGVSEEALGECGACNKLVPLDSTRCPECGVVFVADDVVDILRKWVNDTGVDIRKLFDRFDENSDGMIDSGELKRGLLSLNLADLPPSQIDRLVEEIDRDENGLIDLDEFEIILSGEDHEHEEDDTSTKDEQDAEESADEEGAEDEDDEGDTEEEADEDSEADDEDSEADDEELEAEMDEEDFDIEDEEESTDDEEEITLPIQALADMMDEHDISAQRLFNDLDKDGNGSISQTELVAMIEEKYGDKIDVQEVQGLMEKMDIDGDGMIDIMEFTESMESLDDHEETLVEEKSEKEFPSPMQRRMMSKSWNDAVWPLIHTAFGIMIVVLLVNALIGPVDGSGGMVEYVAKNPSTIVMGDDGTQITEGSVYSCDVKYQEGECANSLTPLAGESSSMPKGFYWDGILFLVIAIGGLIGSLMTHLAIAPSWRERARAMKEVKDDKDDAEQSESDDESDEEDSEKDDEENQEDGSQENEDSEELTDEDEDGEEEDDDDDDGDDEIDIGSHVGLSFEDEEVFGTIIEFDDKEGTVTIKEDGSGDEITGYQEDMFVE